MSNTHRILLEGLLQLNISLDETQIHQLLTYEKEISLFNDIYRLVNAKDDELIIKHFLDSLAPLLIIKDMMNKRGSSTSCADIGSGGGFPAIPLSIALPETTWSLVERSKKRCGFLENVVASCNLAGRVNVLDRDLKEVDHRYDLVTFRAFSSIHEVLSSLQRIITDNGIICAYKGKVETSLDELRQIGTISGDEHKGTVGSFFYQIEPIKVPFLDAQRHLLVLSLH